MAHSLCGARGRDTRRRDLPDDPAAQASVLLCDVRERLHCWISLRLQQFLESVQRLRPVHFHAFCSSGVREFVMLDRHLALRSILLIKANIDACSAINPGDSQRSVRGSFAYDHTLCSQPASSDSCFSPGPVDRRDTSIDDPAHAHGVSRWPLMLFSQAPEPLVRHGNHLLPPPTEVVPLKNRHNYVDSPAAVQLTF